MNRLVRRSVIVYATRSRQVKARRITEFMENHDIHTVAIVGVGGALNPHERLVEQAISQQATIVATLDIKDVDVPWPYVKGDGRALPWRTSGVDLVLSNAVIEHVGAEADQRRLLAEQARVGLTVIVTTPNRWFPVESHTSVLFLHWIPSWRESRTEFTRLLSLKEFKALLPNNTTVFGRPWSPTFMAIFSERPNAGARQALRPGTSLVSPS